MSFKVAGLGKAFQENRFNEMTTGQLFVFRENLRSITSANALDYIYMRTDEAYVVSLAGDLYDENDDGDIGSQCPRLKDKGGATPVVKVQADVVFTFPQGD